MSQGGGFCERHGPYDPPHVSCPYCAMENDQGRGFTPNPGGGYDDEAITNLGAGQPVPPRSFTPLDDEVPTNLGGGHRGGAGQPHLDDRPTELPRRPRAGAGLGYDDDVTELEAAPQGPLGFLIVKEPLMRRGTVYKVQDNYTIGRKGTHIVLNDQKISRQHARIRLEDVEDDEDSRNDEQVFVIYDFGGANGTYVNGKKIRGAKELQENDEIRLGNTVFIFKTMM